VETGNKYGEGETIYAQNEKTWVPDLRTRPSPSLKKPATGLTSRFQLEWYFQTAPH
jgi:hypothetical protein